MGTSYNFEKKVSRCVTEFHLRKLYLIRYADNFDESPISIATHSVTENTSHLLACCSLCPKSPTARSLVACLPVRLLFKSI